MEYLQAIGIVGIDIIGNDARKRINVDRCAMMTGATMMTAAMVAAFREDDFFYEIAVGIKYYYHMVAQQYSIVAFIGQGSTHDRYGIWVIGNNVFKN